MVDTDDTPQTFESVGTTTNQKLPAPPGPESGLGRDGIPLRLLDLKGPQSTRSSQAHLSHQTKYHASSPGPGMGERKDNNSMQSLWLGQVIHNEVPLVIQLIVVVHHCGEREQDGEREMGNGL